MYSKPSIHLWIWPELINHKSAGIIYFVPNRIQRQSLSILDRPAFSAMTPTLWIIFPPEISLALFLLAFHKALKSRFCAQARGPGRGLEPSPDCMDD